MDFRITYAHLLAGRARVSVLPGEPEGRPVLRFVAEAQSQGFFAWLFRFRVEDRTVATWEPESGCSLAVEKRLAEGRAVREQSITFDRQEGVALVTDPKVKDTRFPVGPCVLDVLSAFFVTRLRGVPEKGELSRLQVVEARRSARRTALHSSANSAPPRASPAQAQEGAPVRQASRAGTVIPADPSPIQEATRA